MPRKVRDTRTGRIYFIGDNDENEVKSPQVVQGPLTKTASANNPTSLFEDKVYNNVGRYIPEGLVAGGGIAGGMIGGRLGQPAAGSAVGSAIGSSLGEGLKTVSPNLFGKGPESFGDFAAKVGIDTAVDGLTSAAAKGLGMVFPSVRKRALEQLSKKVYNRKLDPELSAALKADPKFNVTPGQLNPHLEWIENTFAPETKGIIVKQQEKDILAQANRYKFNTELLGETAQSNAEAVASSLKNKSKTLYGKFDPEIAANTVTVRELGKKDPFTGKQLFTDHKIVGAVPITQSGAFVKKLGDEINNILGPSDINAANIGANSGSYLKLLRSELDKLKNVKTFVDPKTGVTGQPLAEFKQLKAIRDGLNDFTQSDEYTLLKGRLVGPLDALSATINADMEEGVKSWGPKAYKSYRAAQDHYKEMALKLDNTMATNLLKAGKDPETTFTQVSKLALSDPAKMRQLIEVSDDRVSARQMFVHDIVVKSFDAANKRFDPSRARQYMADNEAVMAEVMKGSKGVADNFERFLKRAELVTPYSESANVALKLRTYQAASAFTIGGITAMTSGDLGMGVKTGAIVLTGITGASAFAKKALLNPRTARVATELLDLSPKSAKAKWGTRMILGDLKGEQVIFMADDKREYNAQIQENGKVKIMDEITPTSPEEQPPN